MPDVTLISNVDLWNAIRAKFPQFKSVTAEATADLFTEVGFEKLRNGDNPNVLNDFFGLTLRIYLQQINVSRAKDTLSENGFGEYYSTPYGGLIQRMSIDSLKPVSPKFKNLQNGSGPDPFVVRKPTTSERFWKQNFDYQSLITIPDDFQYKQIFVAEYGMSEFMGGLMTALENGYTVQLFDNKLEAINAGINSEDTPLQETQQVEVELSAEPTADELKAFILTVKNVVDAMTLGPQTSAFNAEKFSTIQDKDRLKLLLRPGIKNAIAVEVLANAFNQENLNLPIDVIELPHFGGLIPYKEDSFTTLLYPVYDNLGIQIGYSETEGATTADYTDDEVYFKDPNEDVIGIIADKGYIFFNQQNPYRVEPIRNPRGLYTNYWASSPNNSVCVDHIYNLVTLKNSSEA